MLSMTHWDGADVFVVDSHGRPIPEVSEVRVEPDRAVVAVRQSSLHWWRDLQRAAPEQELAVDIRSRDGLLRWSGPVRLAWG